MNSFVLKILLTIYIFYDLLKFFEFFFRKEESKRAALDAVYVAGGERLSESSTMPFFCSQSFS